MSAPRSPGSAAGDAGDEDTCDEARDATCNAADEAGDDDAPANPAGISSAASRSPTFRQAIAAAPSAGNDWASLRSALVTKRRPPRVAAKAPGRSAAWPNRGARMTSAPIK